MPKYVLTAITVMGLLSVSAAHAVETTATAAKPVMQPVLDTGNIAQLAFSLVFVVVLIIVLAWLFRRFSGAQMSQGGMMKVIAGISLGTRERVVLMQVGEQQVLLGVAPGRIDMLCTLDKPVTVSETTPLKDGSFAERFAEAMKRNLRK